MSWFPSCSPNLPRVYIKLCKHGNHFTFLQSRENLFLILCEGLRRLNCGKVTNDQSNYLFQRFLVTIYQRFFYHQINGVENYEITKCFCVTTWLEKNNSNGSVENFSDELYKYWYFWEANKFDFTFKSHHTLKQKRDFFKTLETNSRNVWISVPISFLSQYVMRFFFYGWSVHALKTKIITGNTGEIMHSQPRDHYKPETVLIVWEYPFHWIFWTMFSSYV